VEEGHEEAARAEGKEPSGGEDLLEERARTIISEHVLSTSPTEIRIT